MLVGEPTGDRDVVLSSPIILYDHPDIAPESAGDLFDATEIDEILTLRIMTLTDEEKAEARATDPRAAAILDRVRRHAARDVERLHGAIRAIRRRRPDAEPRRSDPWWEPGVDAAVDAGDRQRDRRRRRGREGQPGPAAPGTRRADAQDLFLAGQHRRGGRRVLRRRRQQHVAVTLEDDPGADLHVPRALPLLRPDEIEPLPARGGMDLQVLVAGIGNIFLSDDGFGVAVVARLADADLPDGVTVVDFGIRGMHLAYELLDGYDALVLVDALPRDGPPGTCRCSSR